jgi:hypothetical protein
VSEDLSALELEVEQARTKLANDLAVLRSPQPYRTFSADLKSTRNPCCNASWMILKARAAANPSAALAIGAGIAWRLLKESTDSKPSSARACSACGVQH